ncbi:MAG: hypothetical protein CL946_13550 [Ectothiorhodospiraceae bacterium]|nr:hypothetical protein [Ectothiorhodospiraceae bacterium]
MSFTPASGSLSGDEYRFIAELTTDYMYSMRVEPSGKLINLWSNEGFYNHFGIPVPAEGEEYDWKKHTHKDDWDILDLQIELAAKRGKNKGAFEYRIVSENGDVYWVRDYWKVVERTDEGLTLLGAGKDITSEKFESTRLKQDEDRLRLLSDLMSDYAYSYLLEPGGNVTIEWMTGSYERLTGLEIPLDGRPFDWKAAVHPDDIEKVSAKLANLREGERHSFEYRLIDREGSVHWVHQSSYSVPVEDQPGAIRVVGSGKDITAERKVNEALLKSERRFRALLQSIDMVAVILDLDGKVAYCNQYFLDVVGWEEEDASGVDWFDNFIPEVIREEVRKVYLESCRRGEAFPRRYENEILTASGEHRMISWNNTMVFAATGELSGAASIGVDITQQKIVELQLLESEQKFKDLFLLDPDAFIMIDVASMTIIDANEAATQMYGYSLGELKGMNITEISAEKEKTHSAIADSPPGKKIFIPLRYHMRKNGEEFPVEIHTVNESINGKLINFGSVRDITERRQWEQDLIEAKEKAERSEKLKDSFIANMSHEIRTPLNIILGYSSLLEAELNEQLDAEHRDFFASVARAGKRLQNTVEQVLSLSSLSVGAFPMKREVFDLGRKVDHLALEAIPLAQKKGLTLEVTHRSDDLSVFADQHCTDQAVLNIIDNAIKFTHEGGVFVSLYNEGDNCIVEVKDTGIGISDEYLKQSFTMFTQEQSGYTRPYEGLGIGMTLTKLYVEKNGGHVSIQSGKGEGTTVKIALPSSHSKPKRMVHQTRQQGTGDDTPGREGTILVVEDDDLSQKFMNRLLRKHYDVLIAGNVEEAMQSLQANEVDLVFMDLSLGERYDGISCTKMIKSDEKLQHIPVVALTAHALPEDRERCLEAGCSDFMSKPLNQEKLFEVIGKYMEAPAEKRNDK